MIEAVAIYIKANFIIIKSQSKSIPSTLEYLTAPTLTKTIPKIIPVIIPMIK